MFDSSCKFCYDECGRQAASCQCDWHLKSEIDAGRKGLSVGGQQKKSEAMQAFRPVCWRTTKKPVI